MIESSLVWAIQGRLLDSLAHSSTRSRYLSFYAFELLQSQGKTVPLFHIYRHSGEFFESSFFDHLNIQSLTKTLNTTMFSSAFAVFTVSELHFTRRSYKFKQLLFIFIILNRNQCTSYYFNAFRVLWSITVFVISSHVGLRQ